MTGPMLHTVDVNSDTPTIHEAITTKAGEAAFWTSDCDIEPVVGSIARFGFPAAPVDLRMKIDELNPDRIRWACLGDFPHWAGTTVTWTLSPAPSPVPAIRWPRRRPSARCSSGAPLAALSAW